MRVTRYRQGGNLSRVKASGICGGKIGRKDGRAFFRYEQQRIESERKHIAAVGEKPYFGAYRHADFFGRVELHDGGIRRFRSRFGAVVRAGGKRGTEEGDRCGDGENAFHSITLFPRGRRYESGKEKVFGRRARMEDGDIEKTPKTEKFCLT